MERVSRRRRGQPPAPAAPAALRERFAGLIRQRVQTLERAAAALAGGGPGGELRRAAERAAHNLAGTAALFGFAGGTRLARAIERILAGDRPLDAPRARRLSRLVAALIRELEGGCR